MGITSVSIGRVSDLMQSNQLLASLQKGQSALNQVQLQLATGKQIQTPSEDPVQASRIISLSSLLTQQGQYQQNVTYADGLLGTVDSTLSQAGDALQQAHSLALSSVGTDVSDSERQANASLVDALLGQMQRLANTSYQGRQLFDGQAGAGEPFTALGGGVQYSGGHDAVQLPLDTDWTMGVALDGATVFGAESGQANGGGDLDPAASLAMPLADLHGAAGTGVAVAGPIRVSDGVHPAVTIDLSGAATLGDVVKLFNAAAPPGMTLSLDPLGRQLHLKDSPGTSLTVQDRGDGTTALDLGLLIDNGAPDFLAGDLDPKLTERTPLAALRGGAGFDQDSGLVITNGTLTKTLAFSTAQTVGDVLNAINSAGLGVKASIDGSQAGLTLVNQLSGAALRVVENGGSTATDLGLRTFSVATPLASLNGGAGVGRAGAGLADLRITQRDGTSIDVSLDGVQTIGDLFTAVEVAPGNTGDMVASLAPDGGVLLTDYSADKGGSFSVTALNNSTAAAGLGLVQTASAATITGGDTSGAQADGIFSHLMALRDALANNDAAGITKQGGLLETDMNRLTELRGAVGAQAAQVKGQSDQLDQRTVDTKSLLSQVGDLDLTEAIVRFNQIQTQVQAGLAAAGKVLNISLLDFLT